MFIDNLREHNDFLVNKRGKSKVSRVHECHLFSDRLSKFEVWQCCAKRQLYMGFDLFHVKLYVGVEKSYQSSIIVKPL